MCGSQVSEDPSEAGFVVEQSLVSVCYTGGGEVRGMAAGLADVEADVHGWCWDGLGG